VHLLEAREVPAVAYWAGTGSMHDTSNWASGHGLTTDPGPGDDVYFDPSLVHGHTIGDCDDFEGEFRSVTVDCGELYKVILGGDVTADAFRLASGIIDQPGPDITVTGEYSFGDGNSFEWVGGTLNSTATLANLNMLGGLGLIDPGGNTVTTGSNLSFVGTNAAVETTVLPGTVEFRNEAGVVAGVLAAVTIKPTTNGNVNFVTLGGQSAIAVGSGGTFRVTGPGIYNTDQYIGVLAGGTLKIDGGAYSNVTGATLAGSSVCSVETFYP
jgi:hypothetical protein